MAEEDEERPRPGPEPGQFYIPKAPVDSGEKWPRITRDTLIDHVSRAVHSAFPDRAELLIRDLERRLPPGEPPEGIAWRVNYLVNPREQREHEAAEANRTADFPIGWYYASQRSRLAGLTVVHLNLNPRDRHLWTACGVLLGYPLRADGSMNSIAMKQMNAHTCQRCQRIARGRRGDSLPLDQRYSPLSFREASRDVDEDR